MRNLCCFVLLLLCSVRGYAQSRSYLFVWAGDDAKKTSDFLAVLDADSKSPRYGQAVASVAVPGPSGTPHHTELEMPEGGFLLANAFESGRSMLFDLREPLHPSLATSFGDLDGYSHTYVRLPNGHVLATGSLGRTDSMAMPTRMGRCFRALRLWRRARRQVNKGNEK